MIFRRDVEGLRAVAIGGVLVAHANLGFAAGGFCGVDVFYVISGFLITGILVRELEGRGSISLAAFYARRARRILPMAGLVIIVVLLISLVVFSPARRDLLSGDAVASSLYYVNWRFVAQSADYFGASSDLSPLQHYWSLAIEEQFYLVWPALLLGVTLWWRRRGRPSRRAIAGALTVIAVSSLAFSIVDTAAHPPQAYFSTFTRVWELALGGLLALAPVAPLSRATSRAVAWAGLAMIVAAFLLFDAATPFPGYLALLPTLGAVAVIAAGARRPESPPLGVLEARPVRYVGRVSYSWYLWHWPAVIFATELWGPLSPAAGAAVIAASFVPAVVSHHLVELPLMNSRTLKRSPSRSLAFGAATMAAGVATAGLVLAAQPDIETAPGGAVPGAAALARAEGAAAERDGSAAQPDPCRRGSGAAVHRRLPAGDRADDFGRLLVSPWIGFHRRRPDGRLARPAVLRGPGTDRQGARLAAHRAHEGRLPAVGDPGVQRQAGRGPTRSVRPGGSRLWSGSSRNARTS